MNIQNEMFSVEQIQNMRHAIGNQIKNNPYRNYFNVSSEEPSWEDLVQRGFAQKWGNELSIFYGLTDEGIDILKRIMIY